MSRTATYLALGRRDLRAVKCGNRTLIDVDAGLAWLRSLPQAEIRPPIEPARASEETSGQSFEQRSAGPLPMTSASPSAVRGNRLGTSQTQSCAPLPRGRRAR
jgi:hypothetical protein